MPAFHSSRIVKLVFAILFAAAPVPGRAQDAAPEEEEALRRLDRRIDELRRELDELRARRAVRTGAAPAAPAETDDTAALERALADLERERGATREGEERVPRAPEPPTGDIWSRRVGGVNLRLIDLSLDVLAAAGGSTERNEEIEQLQGGGHDPRRRGFTLQQLELSGMGAVDPYFRAEGHMVWFITPEGEPEVELEEAFFQTLALPGGLQLEGGHFLTEFGRINPLHSHAWTFLDQPVILTRLFGGDGMRGPGVRLGWLTPLPWFAELHLGLQNADGETMTSFLGEGVAHGHGTEEEDKELFEEGIGGTPIVERDVRSLEDLVYLARLENGFDLGDAIAAKLGFSGLVGPNNSGAEGKTFVLGADAVLKWKPPGQARGWPFLVWQSEIAYRQFRADRFSFFDAGDDPLDPQDDVAIALGRRRLEDWGFYTYAYWGFVDRWAVGLRYEYASGSGASLEGGEPIDRNRDPFRDDRHRLSPLLAYHPTEFSRIRLQYSYDRADRLAGDDAHSVWLGIEVLFGAHPAHQF